MHEGYQVLSSVNGGSQRTGTERKLSRLSGGRVCAPPDGSPFASLLGNRCRHPQVLAVDSELSQVLQDDHSRLNQLMCHTVRSGVCVPRRRRVSREDQSQRTLAQQSRGHWVRHIVKPRNTGATSRSGLVTLSVKRTSGMLLRDVSM